MNESNIKELIGELQELSQVLRKGEHSLQGLIQKIQPEYRKSAANLIHYRTMRSVDIRTLQKKLGNLGLSRLAKAERHILFSIQTNALLLSKLLDLPPPNFAGNVLSIKQSRKLSRKHATDLLGSPLKGRKTGIMVTIPTEGATDPILIYNMVDQGMTIARINCAHDGPEIWSKAIGNIRTASDKVGRKVKIAMDLGGPKIRTAHSEMIRVHDGETLILTKKLLKNSKYQQVLCTVPDVLNELKTGHPVLFDDGKILTRVTRKNRDSIHLLIERTGPEGAKLKPGKGINMPDTSIKIPGLTDKDRKDLEFIVTQADIINYSFVNSAKDVEDLLNILKQLKAPERLGIILKIETKQAYDNLVPILLATMNTYPVGVMIARGDLTIEAGWSSIGRIQEELIRLCNAAHIPVVWATQVLENLAKKGIPSRSEMTDVTASIRADCVMLNKGPYILEAIQLLSDVLMEEQNYQEKNAPLLPELHSFAKKKSR